VWFELQGRRITNRVEGTGYMEGGTDLRRDGGRRGGGGLRVLYTEQKRNIKKRRGMGGTATIPLIYIAASHWEHKHKTRVVLCTC